MTSTSFVHRTPYVERRPMEKNANFSYTSRILIQTDADGYSKTEGNAQSLVAID